MRRKKGGAEAQEPLLGRAPPDDDLHDAAAEAGAEQAASADSDGSCGASAAAAGPAHSGDAQSAARVRAGDAQRERGAVTGQCTARRTWWGALADGSALGAPR